MSLTFVNCNGEPVSVLPQKKPKAAPRQREAKHEGWIVKGVPPEVFSKASQAKDFNAQEFLNTAKLEKVMAKKFGSSSAAYEMKNLAERYGWVACVVVELKVE